MDLLEGTLLVLAISIIFSLLWFQSTLRSFFKIRAQEDNQRIYFNPGYTFSSQGRKRYQQARADFLAYYGEARLKQMLFYFVLVPLVIATILMITLALNGGELFGLSVRID